jgi:hypothetical protein
VLGYVGESVALHDREFCGNLMATVVPAMVNSAVFVNAMMG